MKYIEGATYNYHYDLIAKCGPDKGKRCEGDFEVVFDSIIDATGYQCSQCGKDLKKGYYFLDVENGESDPSQYFLGSKCVKKVIAEIKKD